MNGADDEVFVVVDDDFGFSVRKHFCTTQLGLPRKKNLSLSRPTFFGLGNTKKWGAFQVLQTGSLGWLGAGEGDFARQDLEERLAKIRNGVVARFPDLNKEFVPETLPFLPEPRVPQQCKGAREYRIYLGKD